jgi:hypothetical protein
MKGEICLENVGTDTGIILTLILKEWFMGGLK